MLRPRFLSLAYFFGFALGDVKKRYTLFELRAGFALLARRSHQGQPPW